MKTLKVMSEAQFLAGEDARGLEIRRERLGVGELKLMAAGGLGDHPRTRAAADEAGVHAWADGGVDLCARRLRRPAENRELAVGFNC